MTRSHEFFILRAIEVAQQAVAKGNHPFGAILVKDGEILLEAQNSVVTEKDCTRHAELNLVSLATQSLDPEVLSLAILYTSTEPCPMCTGAIYWSGIKRLVYACSSERLVSITNHGFLITSQEILNKGLSPVEVIGPILEDQALRQHQDFWT